MVMWLFLRETHNEGLVFMTFSTSDDLGSIISLRVTREWFLIPTLLAHLLVETALYWWTCPHPPSVDINFYFLQVRETYPLHHFLSSFQSKDLISQYISKVANTFFKFSFTVSFWDYQCKHLDVFLHSITGIFTFDVYLVQHKSNRNS